MRTVGYVTTDENSKLTAQKCHPNALFSLNQLLDLKEITQNYE